MVSLAACQKHCFGPVDLILVVNQRFYSETISGPIDSLHEQLSLAALQIRETWNLLSAGVVTTRIH